MLARKAEDPIQLRGTITTVVLHHNGLEPDLRLSLASDDVHVRWLVPIRRIEAELEAFYGDCGHHHGLLLPGLKADSGFSPGV
jgi:hypothetical protein